MMKKLCFPLLLILFSISPFFGQVVWTGLGLTNNWTDAANWSSDPLIPGFNDDVVFNGTSSKNCVAIGIININNLTIASGYTGIIDCSNSAPTVFNFSQAGGTFIAPSGLLEVIGNNLTKTGGVFTNNNGTLLPSVPIGGLSIVGAFQFNTIKMGNISGGSSGTERVVNFGSCIVDTLILTANTPVFSFQGTVNIQKVLEIIPGGATGVPTSNSGLFNFNGTGDLELWGVTGNSAALRTRLPNLNFNVGGDIYLDGNINITGSWSHQSGTLIAGSSIVSMYGTNSISGAIAYFDNLVIQTGANISLQSNSEVQIGRNLGRNGTLTGTNTSTLTFNGSSAQTFTASNIANTFTVGVLNLEAGTTRNITISTASVAVQDALKIGTGVTLVTNGLVRIKASSSMKGRIDQVFGSISGNVTFETYIPGGNYGWAQLGSPGINGVTPAQWDTWYGTSGAFGIPVTCTGCFYSPRFFTPEFHSIQSWSETNQTYDTLGKGMGAGLASTRNLAVGNGYWVFVGDNNTFANPMTLRSNGSVNTGNTSVPVTNAATTGSAIGFNLIANPYPSAISWAAVVANNPQISGTYYSWSAEGGQGTFNGSTGTNGLTDIIPAGQAFYIDNSFNGVANINFTESMKSSNNTTGIYRPAKTESPGCIRLTLFGKDDRDETVICSKVDATDLFDLKYDGKKLFETAGYQGYEGSYSKYTTISTKTFDKQDYSINTIGSLVKAITLPLRVRVSTSGTYTINAIGLSNLNTCYLLYDKLLNTSHDLKTSDYVFTIADTTNSPRFELRLCRDNSLSTETGFSSSKLSNTFFTVSKVGSAHVVKTSFESEELSSLKVIDLTGRVVFQETNVRGKDLESVLPSELNGQVLIVEVRTQNEVLRKRVLLN